MKLFFTLLILTSAVFVRAQSIELKGKISGNDGEAVPFASVYVRNTSIGTSANGEGAYRLPLPKGKYEIVFRAVGYAQQVKTIDLQSATELNVLLPAEAYQLQDVVVKGDGEDPAYEIIRKTIRKRKEHLNEVESFTTDVYIKGMQKLLAAPKKFLGQDIDKMGREIGLDSNRAGILYLSESESKYSYKRPDQVHEEMISSKVSGSNRAFSYNRASDMKVDFYENLQNWEGLSNRPLVSPIADNALFYYNYKFLGSTSENGVMINKIAVTPKRSGDPAFRGSIYIVEDEWRIYSLDLYLTKEANINIVDTLRIGQQFIPVNEGKAWLPSMMKFDFKGGLFGFRFGGYYISVYKNYTFDQSLSRKDFAEVFRVTRETNKKDSAYWDQARPIPLSEEEINDYAKKKVLAQKRESKPYLDSLDKANNEFKLKNFILGSGYSFRNRYERKYYSLSSIKDAFFYNTVEGFGLDYRASYRKQIDSLSNKWMNLSAKARYGFSSENFYPQVSGSFPAGNATIGFLAGGDVVDLNNQGTMTALGNTINSLFYERNRMKLYEKWTASASASGRVYAGLTGSVSMEWANRRALTNTSDYTVRDVEGRSFTSNHPFQPNANVPLFEENQSLKVGFRLNYNFSNKYSTYPWGKVYHGSKYPRLTLGYTQAFDNVLGSDSRYSFAFAELAKEDIPLGFYGKFSFMAGVGTFFNQKNMFYTDFKHFAGAQTLVYDDKPNSFLLLDFYRFSTPDRYVELHAEHNFSGFILNKVPLIRKLKLQELVGANYLGVKDRPGYKEVFFGLQYLSFKGYYGISYQGDKKMDHGFRLSLGF